MVLLIDTSGSMAPSDRLPLLQQGFRLFVQQLRDDDRVAIVTYAGQAQTALEPTRGRDKQKILDVVDGLRALVEITGLDPSDIRYLVHGTTIAVNTVLQRNGATLGLLVTAGFGDIMAWQDGRSVHDTVQCVIEYPNNVRIAYSATLVLPLPTSPCNSRFIGWPD